MSADSSWELQQAVFTALTGDAPLMAMVQGVYDHVPQGAAFPYVTVGESSARPWRAVSLDGVETTLILHVWSRERGRKQAKQIMAEMHRILDDADLTLSGHVLVSISFEFSQTMLDADGVIYHGIARYHANTHTG